MASTADLTPLWRSQPAHRAGRSRRLMLMIAVTSSLIVLGLAVIFLVSWVRPAPGVSFIPIALSGLEDTRSPFPSILQGDHDQLAFETPERNILARSLVPGHVSHHITEVMASLELSRADADTVVVSISARACRDPFDPKIVWLIPGDAPDGLERRASWVALDDALKRVSAHPARNKLLILDLHPLPPDPRLGLPDPDVGAGVAEAVGRYPASRWMVLTSCGPNEVPATSEALGRSIFSFYLEEGLRGWADVAEPGETPDGRVTALELASYVQERVERWVRRNRGARQRPTLLQAPIDDFPLVVLRRGQALAHLTLADRKSIPSYPDWLSRGWKVRDDLRRKGVDREAPRIVSELEQTLMAAEHNWRGGADPEHVRTSLARESDRLLARLGPVRTIPGPRPSSLAKEPKRDKETEAIAVALRAMLAKRAATPGATEASDAASIAGFYAGMTTLTDVDLGSAVMKIASEIEDPKRETILFLEAILRTRQPRPRWIETLALERLGSLSPADWHPDLVHLALRVATRGELALARPSSFESIRPLLDGASQARHEGETLLRAPDFASSTEADRSLRQADRAIEEVIAGEEVIEHAQRLIDESFWLLPAFGPLVDPSIPLDEAWKAAATETLVLMNALEQNLPVDPSAARDRLAALERLTASLQSRLEALREPLALTRMAGLSSPDAPATAETYDAINALIKTPFLDADQRAALWASLWSIDLKLAEQTSRLDTEEGRIARVPNLPSDSDRLRFERDARARLERRSQRSLALLSFCGYDPAQLDELRSALRSGPDPAVLAKLSRAWLDLPNRLRNEPSEVVAERLGRMLALETFLPRLDDPARSPTRRLRIRDQAVLQRWLSELYAFEARDFGGSPFYAALADEYRPLGTSPASSMVEVSVEASPPVLDPAHPSASVPLVFRLSGPDLEAKTNVDIVTIGDWLRVRRGSPWPSAKSPFPAIESQPLAFDLGLATTGAVPIPLDVRIGTESSGTLPLGFLVRSRLGYRTTHQKVPVLLVPISRQLRISLSGDAAKPSAPIADLRLRPIPELPSHFLYVENPTDADRKLLVQLRAGGAIVPGYEVPITVKGRGFEKVVFGPPAAKPELDRFPLVGPLVVRLLDASDAAKVVGERTIPVGVAIAGDFVRVVDARFDPANGAGGKARLTFKIRAVGPVVGPPLVVEMVLSPDRIPGLVAPGEGTFRVELANEGDEATLFAEGLLLDPRDDELGYVDLTVDAAPRAMIYKTTFARGGEPTTPQLDTRPGLRLRAASTALAGSSYEVGLLLDRPPAEGRVELVLGRYEGAMFRPDKTREILAEKASIQLNPRGPAGALRFEAQVRDPVVSLDVQRIRGRRMLQARLLEPPPDGRVVATAELPILFDDRAPAGVKFVNMPKYALKGGALTLAAAGDSSGVGVKRVSFFVGKPVDGKLPPNTSLIEAKPVDVGRTVWSAPLPVPAQAPPGPLEVSVQFESAVGLSSFDTASVQVVDAIPIEPGKLKGKVVEGTRPQVGFEVVVLDPKGAAKGSATTDKDGRFEVAGLPPGAYRVISDKATPPTRGEAEVTIAPGADAEVTVEMLRTRTRRR